MMNSNVQVSMRDDNGLNCSYAVIRKEGSAVLLLLKDAECAVFDLHTWQKEWHYLLFKHYDSGRAACRDFYKLIGKMCAKSPDSKYFGQHRDEDNRMAAFQDGQEHMLTSDELPAYAERYAAFREFAMHVHLDL